MFYIVRKLLKCICLKWACIAHLNMSVLTVHQCWAVLDFCIKHCLDFSFVFLPEETCFQQAGSFAVEGTSRAVPRIFWPAEGTSQPVTVSKKWKNPSSLFVYEMTGVHRPFRDFRPVPLAYRPRAQISNTKSLWFRFFNKIRMVLILLLVPQKKELPVFGMVVGKKNIPGFGSSFNSW